MLLILKPLLCGHVFLGLQIFSCLSVFELPKSPILKSPFPALESFVKHVLRKL